MRKLLMAGILLACTSPVWAQQFNGLKIGDTVPDITIGPVENYPKQQIRLSDLKGKLVLLDFWYGACPGCIESFPKLEALQKKFGDRLQVIMVNYESRDEIEKTFNRYSHIHKYRFPNAPSIIGDILLHKLFPHKYVPHEVWIDRNRVVRAYTSVREVTEENLLAMLEGRPVKMDMKVDNFTFKGDIQPTLAQVYDQNPGCLKYYSAILNYIPGIDHGVTRCDIDTSQKTIRISRRNMTILHLFSSALVGGMGNDPFESPNFDFGKRVILHVRDSSRYIYKPRQGMAPGEWKAKNCFTYESVMPLSQKEKEMFTSMHNELERFFNVRGSIEKRKMRCLALVSLSNKSPKSIMKFDKPLDTAYLQAKGLTTGRLLERISAANRYTPYVFCDRTGIEDRLDVQLKKSLLSDIPQLKLELRSHYDLDLVESEQDVDVLVLKEN